MMEKGRPPGRSRRRFTKEFKADAVALVLCGAVCRCLLLVFRLGCWPVCVVLWFGGGFVLGV